MRRTALLLALALIAASFLSGIELRAGNLNIRPEQIAATAVLGAALLMRRPTRFPPAGFLVLGWILAGVLGAAGAPGPERALVHTARLLATALPVVLLPALLREPDDAEAAWDGWLVLSVLACAVALGAWASHFLFGTTAGVTVENRLGFVHPHGTFLEPNVLGALSAAAALPLMLRASRRALRPRERLLALAGAALALMSLAASVTRAAWIALPVALAALFLLRLLTSARPFPARPVLLAGGAGAVALLVVLVLWPGGGFDPLFQTREGVAGRIAALGNPAEDPNVAVRLKSYRAALAIWSERPFLGAGHGAMERVAALEDFELKWAGNLEIHTLADTGLLGLLLLLGFAAFVLLSAARHALLSGDPGLRGRHQERLGALIVLLITVQATETSWLSSFWVLFGLSLASLSRAARAEPGRKMRVLYVHPSDELYGSDRVLLELVSNLKRDRFDPLVLLSSDVRYRGLLGRRLAAEGVRVIRLRMGILRRRAFASAGRLVRFAADLVSSTIGVAYLIGRERIDIVHANTVTVLPGALAALLTGRRLVWHLHEIVPDRLGKRALVWFIVHAADWTVVVSRSAAASLGGQGRARLLIIPNGLPDRGPSPEPAAPPVVSFIGRLSLRKGPGVFLEAAARIAARHPDVRFVLAGDEFGGGEDLRALLEREAARLGISDRALFRPFREETSALYAEASIVVSPSLAPESFGLVVLEAMAAGRPVIASRHGGPAELVVDGETGLLVPPGDPAALAEALDRLLLDPGERRRMGEAGRRRALSLFPIERTVARFEELYLRGGEDT